MSELPTPKKIEVPDFVPQRPDYKPVTREVVPYPEGVVPAHALNHPKYTEANQAIAAYADHQAQAAARIVEGEETPEARAETGLKPGDTVTFHYIIGEPPYSGVFEKFRDGSGNQVLSVTLDAESTRRNGGDSILAVPTSEIIKPVETLSEQEREDIEDDLGIETVEQTVQGPSALKITRGQIRQMNAEKHADGAVPMPDRAALEAMMSGEDTVSVPVPDRAGLEAMMSGEPSNAEKTPEQKTPQQELQDKHNAIRAEQAKLAEDLSDHDRTWLQAYADAEATGDDRSLNNALMEIKGISPDVVNRYTALEKQDRDLGTNRVHP